MKLIETIIGGGETILDYFGVSQAKISLAASYFDVVVIGQCKKYIDKEIDHLLEKGDPATDGYRLELDAVVTAVLEKVEIIGEAESFAFGITVQARRAAFEERVQDIFKLFALLMMMKRTGMEDKEIQEKAKMIRDEFSGWYDKAKDNYENYKSEFEKAEGAEAASS